MQINQNKYSSMLSLASSLLSLLILIVFLIYYSVPPLVDFQAHVALGTVDANLSQFYQYQPSLTYRLFDTIVRFWHLIFGEHYTKIASASYLCVLFLIFSPIYSFCLLQTSSYQRAFSITAFLIGPLFVLLHSNPFIWGTMPYILAIFMAIGSSISLWGIILNRNIFQDNRSPTLTSFTFSTRNSSKILFVIYTALAIYSHVAGFLYLAIGWFVPTIYAIYYILSQTNNSKNYSANHFKERLKKLHRTTIFCLLLYIFLIILSFFFHSETSLSLISQFSHSLFPNAIERMHWLLGGYFYYFENLIPVSLGLFGRPLFRIALTFISLVFTVYLFFLWLKKNNKSANLAHLHQQSTSLQSHWLTLITAQLGLQFFLIIFILPISWGELLKLFSRHWLFISGWIFLGIAYLVNQYSDSTLEKLSYFSPILTLICCMILLPLYSLLNDPVPIENAANNCIPLLLKAVEARQKQEPDLRNKTIVIDVTDHNLHNLPWNQKNNFFVPYIMMHSPILIKHHIIIRAPWALMAHIPVAWKQQPPETTRYFLWDNEVNSDVIVLKSK